MEVPAVTPGLHEITFTGSTLLAFLRNRDQIATKKSHQKVDGAAFHQHWILRFFFKDISSFIGMLDIGFLQISDSFSGLLDRSM